MKHKTSSLKLASIVFALAFFLIIVILPSTLAANRTHEISTFSDLLYYANLSKTEGYNDDTYILTNDITITANDQATLDNGDVKYISFGSGDVPFTGTFDGNGYTISNLNYDKSVAGNNYDTGLIAQTDTGAVVRNLIIDNANIDAVYRGGIVIGYAKNTLVENVTVKNSHLSMSAADNILTLITDGGVRGGAIAGDSLNSVFYNCEGNDNFININNTSGVAALAGKGITVAGLVGILEDSEVEYSRVLGGDVRNYYDVAVGAVSGNSLYVGGMVGQMKSASKVIDSYSTATLYYYCGTYVSVGAGNVGYIGGIAARMAGDQNEIHRSHYAGVATSRQYNAVLVVPVIQDNVNISGISESYGGGSVVSTYFKPSLNPNVDMKVLGNGTSTTSYGPLTDAEYIDRDFWQEKGYDFIGNTKRNTGYNNNHYNKWVIDYETGMPIHGNSVSATLDFPGAGTVTIGQTSLVSNSVSTSNPYVFAVQGIKKSEYTVDISASENEGYKFISWYKVPNVRAWQLEENHDYFDEVFNTYTAISNNKNLNDEPCDDNNLFIAKYKAKVTYHNINGDLINASTGNYKTSVTDDDWYYYNELITDMVPTVTPSSSTAKLIGWTTIKSNEAGNGYSDVSAPVLSNLKANNSFYEAGDKITKAMDLYPVYTDLTSNITTVFEGHDQDTIDNVSLRDGVGTTGVSLNNNNNVVLTVTGTNNGSFPAGYRFLGWYDENDMKVSSDAVYTITDIDLTVAHTFTARFEYKVSYYVRAYKQNNQNAFTTSTLYAERWQTYNSAFENIGGPSFVREYVTHWGTSHADHGSSNTDADKYDSPVVAPISVYSHNYSTITGNGTGYALYADMDFPGSGSILDEGRTNGASLRYTPVSNRYNLLFWTLERNNNSWTYSQNPLSDWLSNLTEYKARAFVTASIIFHDKEDNLTTVQRRYDTNVFQSQNENHSYYYPHIHTSDLVKTSASDSGTINNPVLFEASPSDASMKITGYAFLGWISSDEVEENSSEWNYIYDVANDDYCTSSVSKVEPYLLRSTDTKAVTEAIDLYPVYAKYNVITQTNISLDGIVSKIHAPLRPTYTLPDNDNLNKIITITPDTNTYVEGNSGDVYELKALTISKNGGEEVVIEQNQNGLYQYEIEPGSTYVVTAYYTPYVVVYHTNTNEKHVEVKNVDDVLGDSVTPEFSVADNYVFIGWTKRYPSNHYHSFNTYADFTNSGIAVVNKNTLVTESMELWPVYVQTNINYNSNIDSYLQSNSIDLSSVRTLVKTAADGMQLRVLNNKVGNYNFIGWYKNYVNSSNMGTFVTDSCDYDLQLSEMFSTSDVYTAVYEEVYDVNYYDTDGNILLTVHVSQSENRTFVEQNFEGDETPIDYEAFLNIYNHLDVNEYFVRWQWVKANNDIVSWDNFKNSVITSDMNLYPVINRISVYDANNNAMNLVTQNNVEPKVSYGIVNDKIVFYFTDVYTMPWLKVHVDEVAYGNTTTTTAKSNVNTEFYKDETRAELLDSESTDNNGDAILNFYGVATITKNQVVGSNANEKYIFNIVNSSNINVVIQKVTIKNGSNIKVKLPYGSYSIIEDSAWAWRYNAAVTGNLTVNNASTGNITITNTKINDKWFDGVDSKKNKY